ncbi:MAG: 30S ribosomal protein S20 [Deltaproteobacteria bacterium]|nr:30S ribosomal protein S20 [Deltaproteobacteria bacterium]
MATHKQAEKRHRQSVNRAERNSYYEATLRSVVKSARVALAAGDKAVKATTAEAVKKAVSWIDHVAVKGIIPKQRASRLKSRLESQLASR